MIEEKYFVAPGLQVVRIDDTRLSLNLYGRRFTLKDETGLIEAIFVSAARNGVTGAQLLEEHPNGWPSEVVETVLKSLHSSHFLLNGNKRSPALAVADLLAHSSGLVDKVVSSFGAPTQPYEWNLLIAGEGELSNQLGEALTKFGLKWSKYSESEAVNEESQVSTLMVACADSNDHDFFRQLNRESVEAGVAVLFVSTDAHVARCGPMVMPKANACYECYFHRVSSTRAHTEEFEAAAHSENLVCQPTPNLLTLQWAVSAALTQILAVISGLDMDLHLAPMQEINVLQGEISNSKLLKIPRCPVCGVANGSRPFSSVINTKLALKAG